MAGEISPAIFYSASARSPVIYQGRESNTILNRA
jgi:hypothetical protein